MDIFAVIADPTRRKMIDMMRAGEQSAGIFVAAFPAVSQPAISQHLKVFARLWARVRSGKVADFSDSTARRNKDLESDSDSTKRNQTLVSVRADRQRRLYSLRPEGLAPVKDWLATQKPEPAQPKPQRPKKHRPLSEPAPLLDLFG